MEADISGSQRKVVFMRVHPRKRAQGTTGIALKRSKTLPFIVTRAWSAPAGVYPEQWFLVDPVTRGVLFEAPVRQQSIWGLQGLTELSDEITTPIDLEPGTYLIVFSLGRVMGGEFEVEAAESPAQEAA